MAIYRIKRFSAGDEERDELNAEFYDLARSKRQRDKKLVGKDAKKGAIIGSILGAAGGGIAGGLSPFGGKGALGGAAGGAIAGGLNGAGIGALVGAYRRHKRHNELRDLKDMFQTTTPEMRKKLLTRLKNELNDEDDKK